jgi:hypothetical protein
MDAPIFKCSKCQRDFSATEKDEAPLPPQEQLDKLKATWLAKEKLLDDSCARGEGSHTAPELVKMTHAKLASSCPLAWLNYASVAFHTGVWKVPNELISVRGYSGWSLVCEECNKQCEHSKSSEKK